VDAQGDTAKMVDADLGRAEVAEMEVETIQDQNQGSSNRGEIEAKAIDKGVKGNGQTVELVPGKPADSVFCHRCKIVGHYTKECSKVWMGDREEFQGTC
jgi:hypothetical protein